MRVKVFTLEREARPVTIHMLEFVAYEGTFSHIEYAAAGAPAFIVPVGISVRFWVAVRI